ncbi:MAGa3780 family membrane protein [Mycoplasmopsis cynos]|uniref:MAGa3780 family membrane protein n=1 Tax=Mycoplasmopsis cynos TaxID=171284 RepID=UPI00220687CA|nr:hypothetical protein [Mycoplasmopsis cynos]UWV92561.1 hypothetical protein NWE57_00250 [Mycoplasmopsis cynos]
MKQNFKTKQQLSIFIMGLFVLLSTMFFVLLNVLRTRINGLPIDEKDNFYINFSEIFDVFVYFLYYTTLSNIFLGFVMMILSFKYNSEKVLKWTFNAIILITITFLVYWALISWTQKWKDISRSIYSIITHCINPILGFICLFIVRKKVRFCIKSVLLCSILVISYFLFAFIVYFATVRNENFKNGAIIYKFLHFYRPFYVKNGQLAIIIPLDIIIFLIGLFAYCNWLFLKVCLQNSKC